MSDARATAERRWWPPSSPDAFVVLIAGLVQVGGTALAARHQTPVRDLDPGGYALLAAGVLLLVFRRAAPVAVLAGVFVTTGAYLAFGYPGGPIWVSLIIALAYTVVTGHRRAAITTLVAGFLVFPWLPFVVGNDNRPSVAGVLGLAAWLIAMLAIIETVNTRRERARDAARSAVEAARRQVADERVRIARDLHDAVAHSMSLIHIQAGVALHLIDEQPAQARDALGIIKQASKDALVELRSILGVLRDVDEDAPRVPAPSLARIDELVAHAAMSGVDVRVDADDDLAHLPRNVDLAAYRIVQESLTNVARHAHPPEAVVRLHADNGSLTVEVLDDGTTSPGDVGVPSGGNGIAGMRERAASVGGHLSAGPRPGRGFAVRAELPLGDPA